MSKGDGSKTSLSYLIFNEYEIFPQKFADLISVIVRIYRIHDSETLDSSLKELSDQNIWVSCIDSCYRLLHKKYYIDITSEKTSFDNMSVDENMDDIDSSDANDAPAFSNKKKIISHGRLIHLFWEYCDDKLDYILRELMDISIPQILDLQPFDIKKSVEAFRNTYSTVWKIMKLLSPILQYVYLNYPQIFQNYVSKDSTFEDYINKKIYVTFKDRMNETHTGFKEFLKASFSSYMCDESWLEKTYNKTTLLRFAFLYNESIDDQPLEYYYFSQLQTHLKTFDYKQYFYKENKTDISKSAFELIFLKELKNQTLLAYMFSPTWMEIVANYYAEEVLMREDMIAECYTYYKINNLDSYKIDINNDIGMFRYAYISRNKKREVDQICEKLIYNEIKELYSPTDKSSLLQVFNRLRYQVIFFSRIYPPASGNCGCDYECECFNKEIPEFFHSAYTKFFGNETKLIQAILKYIELKEKLSLTHAYDISLLVEDLTIILKKLSISSSITTLYSESLFRYILMNYEVLVNQITQQDCALKTIDGVVTVFTNVYKDKLENVSSMWQHFKEHAVMVSKVKGDSIDDHLINLFLLPLTDIPEFYQHMNEANTLNNVKLPEELEDTWNDFKIKHLNEFLPQAKSKTVHLMYGLQYCDVETQFLTADGVPLHLELTLYQTCVLNEFNDQDKVTFAYLVDTLQMDPINLKSILNSFLNIGLIKVNEDKSFSVNASFKANEKKIRYGKLRVVIGRVRNTP